MRRKSVFNLLSVIGLILAMTALTVGATARVRAQASVPGLVLWNKLGSDDEILHSEVGENGVIVGTSHAYEPAQHGNGYVRKAYGQNYVKFPSSIMDDLTHRGTVELWINPKVPQPVPYQYGVFGLLGAPYGHGGVPEVANVRLHWGDGVTGRGILGGVTFEPNFADYVQTPWEPTQYVATPFEPFHTAICWDIAGIDGTDDKVRVYRDGQVVGSHTASWNPDGTERYDLILGYGADLGGFDKYIVDNIVIWNYAKTDFSDRFCESPSGLPPTADAGGPYLVAAGASIQLDGTGSDPELGPLAFLWTATGGSFVDAGLEDAVYLAVGGTGVFDLTLTVADFGGLSDSDTTFVAVYDPSAGFVTGGGWIDSPEGAYVPDPTLTGKASFGFVSRYKTGTQVPEGNTEFQFKAGDLNFHADSYDWLVVNQGGTNAQFKGTGTINGSLAEDEAPYRFMLWAGDGSGGSGGDTFRIKVWWEESETEHVVYDNGSDQEIGGGSIVVHAK